jgi:chorismate mutase
MRTGGEGVAEGASDRAAGSDRASGSDRNSGGGPPGDPPSSGNRAGAGSVEDLEALRSEIADIDRELIRLIAQRVALARSVGVLKRELGMPALDPAREAAVVRHAGALAREAGVSDEDVRYIFWHLIGLARRAQMEEE